MTKKTLLIPLPLCLILIVVNLLQATTVERLGLEDLVKKSQTIIVGKVTDSRTYWTPDHKLILTNYTIQVDESIKGGATRNVEVTTIGGKIGDQELHVSGMVSFAKGENAIVFIEQKGAYQLVVGMGQGKFTVTNGEVTNSVADLSFPDGRSGSATKMPLQNFKNQIRSLLNR